MSCLSQVGGAKARRYRKIVCNNYHCKYHKTARPFQGRFCCVVSQGNANNGRLKDNCAQEEERQFQHSVVSGVRHHETKTAKNIDATERARKI